VYGTEFFRTRTIRTRLVAIAYFRFTLESTLSSTVSAGWRAANSLSSRDCRVSQDCAP
jgi:hypothetical protein